MEHVMPLLLLSLCGWALGGSPGAAQRARGDSFLSHASDLRRDYEPYVYAAVPLHPPMPVLHVISPKPLAPPERDTHRAYSKHRPIYAKPSFAHSDYGTQSYSQSAFERPSEYGGVSYPQPEYARPSHAHTNYHPFSYNELEFSKPSYTHFEYVRPTLAELYPQSSYTPPHSQLSLSETNFLPLVHPSSLPHVSYAKPPHQKNLSYSDTQESAPTILYAKPTAHGGYSYNREPTRKRKGNARKKSPKKESPMIIRLHKYRVTRNR